MPRTQPAAWGFLGACRPGHSLRKVDPRGGVRPATCLAQDPPPPLNEFDVFGRLDGRCKIGPKMGQEWVDNGSKNGSDFGWPGQICVKKSIFA